MASIRSKSNKWQARIKRSGILVEKSFLNKRDAERWARITEAQIERGEYRPPCHAAAEIPPARLAELLSRYEVEVAPQHRSTTSIFNIRTLRQGLGETLLSDLDAHAVARWRDKRLKQVQPTSVVRELHTLSSILNHARKEWCYAVDNPIHDVKRPAEGQPRTRRLVADEEERLMNSLDPRYSSIVRFALATAMRQGEILSLTWSNVDFGTCVALLPITKNGESRRVPLSSIAIGILQQKQLSLVNSNEGAVFGVSKSTFNKGWLRACKHGKIKNLHFHDLRHEAVSRLFERGLNMMEVAAISGHKTLSMLQRYTHLKAEDLVGKLG